jgi:hypothetical protein
MFIDLHFTPTEVHSIASPNKSNGVLEEVEECGVVEEEDEAENKRMVTPRHRPLNLMKLVHRSHIIHKHQRKPEVLRRTCRLLASQPDLKQRRRSIIKIHFSSYNKDRDISRRKRKCQQSKIITSSPFKMLVGNRSGNR